MEDGGASLDWEGKECHLVSKVGRSVKRTGRNSIARDRRNR